MSVATAGSTRPGPWPTPVGGSALPAVLALACAYGLSNLALPRMFNGGWNLYLAQPLVWLGLGFYCLGVDSPSGRGVSRPVLALAVGVGVFQVAVLAGAGLLFGFGRTPYARELFPLLGNLGYLAALVFGTEQARALLLREGLGRLPAGLVLVALLFACAEPPFEQWRATAAGEMAAPAFAGGTLLPAAAESWLTTLLAGLGGPWAAIAYRFVLQATEWLSPVLPNLGWTQTALVGVLAPGLAAVVLRPGTAPSEKDGARRQKRPLWLVTSGVVLVAVVWLNTGLLGVRPAIVSGVSMEPNLIVGDIVIARSMPARSLAVGDVVRFQAGGVPVLHRIREVRRTPQGLVFVTQGDNNAYPDEPVPAAVVEGKVVLTIPKLGLVPVTLKRWLGR